MSRVEEIAREAIGATCPRDRLEALGIATRTAERAVREFAEDAWCAMNTADAKGRVMVALASLAVGIIVVTHEPCWPRGGKNREREATH